LLIWADSAKCDLLDIQLYLADIDPVVGLWLALKIARKAEILESQPLIGKRGLLEGTREWLIAGFPYKLVYQLNGEDVEVLRVIHLSRNWP